jgi:hypothetical protein
MFGRTPRDAVKKMEDPVFADERRQGINRLVDTRFGKRPPYTERYAQIAQMDTDYTVRAVAIRALNRSRDKSATQVFVRGLGDDNALVRLEAAKALNRLPDPAAAPALIAHLAETHATDRTSPAGVPEQREETRDVRIAAAEALKHYKTLDVARALVAVLDARDFGVAWQARQSLRRITGQDFGYNQAAWLTYITGPNNPFG